MPSISENNGFPLPGATSTDQRLADIVAVKDALTAIDQLLANFTNTADMQAAITAADVAVVAALKAGVSTDADNLSKIKSFIDDLQANIGSLNSASSAHSVDIANLTSSLAAKASVTHSHTKADIGLGNVDNTADLGKPISTATQSALDGKVNVSSIGAANGVASLDAGGKIPSEQLPSYVDDVQEASTYGALPATGVSGTIYVTTDTDKTYRWSGSTYIEISAGGAAGVTSINGESGAITLDKADVGLSNVDNTSDNAKPVSAAVQSALNNKASLSGIETLNNKTVEAGVFTGGYTEESIAADTGTSFSIDLANGSFQILTLSGNTAFVFPSASVPGKGLTILLKQDATGNRSVTWPTNVVWPGNQPPSLTSFAGKTDKLVFNSDGVNWLGSVAGLNY